MFMVRCWVIKGHQIKALILKKKKEVGIIPRPCPVMTSVCLWCSFPQSFSWKKTYVLGNRLLLKLCYIYTLGKLFLFCIIYQLFSMQTNPNLCHSFKYVSYQEGTSCSLCFFFHTLMKMQTRSNLGTHSQRVLKIFVKSGIAEQLNRQTWHLVFFPLSSPLTFAFYWI